MGIRDITLLAFGSLVLVAGAPRALRGQQAAGAEALTGAATASGAREDSPATPIAKPTLADFAWLAGRWQGAWGPRTTQQVWLPPKADAMLGTFQVSENGKTLVIELYSLVQTPGGIELHLRHFTPSLVPWEKSATTVLELASVDARSIVFDNAADGQPKHEVMTRVDPDTYISRAEITSEKGDAQVVAITYHRQREAAASHRR